MAVDRPLGRAGAAAGEEDRSGVAALCPGRRKAKMPFVVPDQLFKGRPAPEDAATDGDMGPEGAFAPAEDQPGGVCPGDADEGMWFRLGDAALQVPDPQPRIDQDRHGTDLEER